MISAARPRNEARKHGCPFSGTLQHGRQASPGQGQRVDPLGFRADGFCDRCEALLWMWLVAIHKPVSNKTYKTVYKDRAGPGQRAAVCCWRAVVGPVSEPGGGSPALGTMPVSHLPFETWPMRCSLLEDWKVPRRRPRPYGSYTQSSFYLQSSAAFSLSLSPRTLALLPSSEPASPPCRFPH